MQNYLSELEIINYVTKSNDSKLNQPSRQDLLIILEQPKTEELDILFNKILTSMVNLNNKFSYKVCYADELNVEHELQISIANNNYKKMLVFGQNLTEKLKSAQTVYNLNNNSVFTTASLAEVSKNINLKKELWQNLKQLISEL